MLFRRMAIWCLTQALVLTQSVAFADAAGDAAAIAAAANSTARGNINAGSATTLIPAYTANPPETALAGQGGLSGAANAKRVACALTPNDPTCQAIATAVTSANTPRPAVSSSDPAIVAARQIARNPSIDLGSLAEYYTGCTTAQVITPAHTETRNCARFVNVGNYSCAKKLAVEMDRSSSCTPTTWYAHAQVGGSGLDAQCIPDRDSTKQHFRVTDGGSAVAFFDVDMTTPITWPMRVGTAAGDRGVFVANNSCTGDDCSLKVIVAQENPEICLAKDDGNYLCSAQPTFLPTYPPCPGSSVRGDRLLSLACLFSEDSSCVPPALPIDRCYFPSADQSGELAFDITGAVPGSYWQYSSTLQANGWMVNPSLGAIPIVQLDYRRATITNTPTDVWADQCPALAPGGRCTVQTPARCVDGPATKMVDGVSVTRDCWEYETTLSCDAALTGDQCAPLAASGCTKTGSTCSQANPATGTCEVYQEQYACDLPAETVTTTSNCPTDVSCVGSACFNIARTSDTDFARSMTMLEAVREAGVYMDTDRMQVFKGEVNSCRDRALKNCCYSDSGASGMSNHAAFAGSRLVYDMLMNSGNAEFIKGAMAHLLVDAGFSGSFSAYGFTVAVNGTALPAGSVVLTTGENFVVVVDPWTLAAVAVVYVVMALMECSQDESRVAMKEGAGLCHTIGSYCTSCIRVLGHCVSCIEDTYGKCCFNSKLARIINEQGRAQLHKGWGSAQSPDCSGFTIAQLQSLNFGAMDLTEFYSSLVPTGADLGAIQNRGAAKVTNCYYGQGKC